MILFTNRISLNVKEDITMFFSLEKAGEHYIKKRTSLCHRTQTSNAHERMQETTFFRKTDKLNSVYLEIRLGDCNATMLLYLLFQHNDQLQTPELS
jgi:hypothetical protein